MLYFCFLGLLLRIDFDPLPEWDRDWGAGDFRLDEDEDDGHVFWRGGGPGDKDETAFAPGESMTFYADVEVWPIGTRISITEPVSEDYRKR